jgi:multiple sugar transport system permease protein
MAESSGKMVSRVVAVCEDLRIGDHGYGNCTMNMKAGKPLIRPRYGIRSLKRTILWVLLFLCLMWSFFPILYIAISSFKLPTNIWNYPPEIKGPFSVDNYKELVVKWPVFFKTLRNSALITVGTSLLTLICSVPAAFAFSRYRNKWLRIPALCLILVRMLPPIAITIPMFPICNEIGLVDKHITLILLYSAFEVSLSTWIMKTFIDEVPVRLEEAAMVDGCSRLQAFIRIVLPLSSPGFVAVIVFNTIFAWNEYLFAFVFTSSAARTAPITLAEFLGSIMGVAWGTLLAASTIQLVPILIVVWLLQRFLIKGMQIGAVK